MHLGKACWSTLSCRMCVWGHCSGMKAPCSVCAPWSFCMRAVWSAAFLQHSPGWTSWCWGWDRYPASGRSTSPSSHTHTHTHLWEAVHSCGMTLLKIPLWSIWTHIFSTHLELFIFTCLRWQLWPSVLCAVMMFEAYPSCHWLRGRVHPVKLTSPSQGYTETAVRWRC